MKRAFSFIAITSLFLVASSALAGQSALEAASRIAGKYTGSWKMYGLKDGQVVETASWTDVLVAANPKQADGRAFVAVTDEMNFDGGFSRTSKFTEGYFAGADGSAGDRFYEIAGQPSVFKKLTENDWVLYGVPQDYELDSLGFDPKSVISKSHVTTKSTTYDGRIDTDHVTRLTTIQWYAPDGSVKSIQFVSMKGEHPRVAGE